jgi:hypothetical protein
MTRRAATTSPHEIEFHYTRQLHQNIMKWIDANLNTPEFKNFRRQRLEYTLYDNSTHELADFVLAPELLKQHAVIVAFYSLCQSQKTMAQCEYYFRRFPFRSLLISRDDHLQNICALYFSTFYMMECRIKTTLNSLKAACPHNTLQGGKIIRAFKKEFDDELRARNRVHHHEAFDDIELNRISITGVISGGEDSQSTFWRGQHVFAYRKFSREWSLQARLRSRIAQSFVEVVALGILTEAPFLRFPDIEEGSSDHNDFP